MTIEENLTRIQQKINDVCKRVNRDPGEIHLIAVTKYVSVDEAEQAIAAGITHIGENRDDGLLEKKKKIGNRPFWHFIGTLQSRKVKNMIEEVDYIHSLDRLSLAEEINKRAAKKINCFVQVNTSGEQSKHGLSPQEVIPFIQTLSSYEKLHIVGLMTMAPNTENGVVIRNCFSKLKALSKDVQALKLPFAPCQELSMGMSNDYEIAIEEGATFLRIGTSLFI